MRRTLSALVVTGSLLVGLPTAVLAQTNPGFTFGWGGGVPGNRQLPYHLDNGTPNLRDRYELKIPRKKASVAISQILINYPDYYRGTFDREEMKIRVNGDEVPLAEVNLDPENRIIELTPESVIPAGNRIEVVLDVKNPANGGMYYFNCRVNSPGGLPLSQYIGTWILSIFRS